MTTNMKQQLIVGLLEKYLITENLATTLYAEFMADKDEKEYLNRTEFSVAFQRFCMLYIEYLSRPITQV